MGAEDPHPAAAGAADRLPPETAAALGRVARTLVASGTLAQLAGRALTEMRAALGLGPAVLYLPDPDGRPALQRFVESGGECARAELSFDEEAWKLAVAGGRPLVFLEEGSWLVANPFQPPAASWLALPLAARGRLVGVVVAATLAPLRLDSQGAMVLALLGDLLGAGIATASLRAEVQRTEIQRERMRLAADVHDGLAQDLALALREIAFLDGDPDPAAAAASRSRLREAIGSAHRIVRARLEDLAVLVPVGGAGAAVEEVCARTARDGLPVDVRVGGPVADVPPETLAVVLRVLTEALTNARKHAQATRAAVVLEATGAALTLEVHDDGVGFAADAAGGPGDGHFGLTIMRERARGAGGDVRVEPVPAGGTQVVLELPVGA